MAKTLNLAARISPELLEQARLAAGLPASATPSEVMRYALAVMAGKPDPHVIAARPGRYLLEPPEIEQARRAYRASLATGKRLSRERLVRQFGIAVRMASRIMAEVEAAGGAAA